ncbi:MAG: hypothetical protein R3222_08365 [Balneolaceae bacterium]|nr:hypothetical protein [Balneolaceae bacterium]
MSRKEIYAWCSLGISVSILGYYSLSVFGLPAGVEAYEEQITGILWKVLVVAFLVELGLDLLNSGSLSGVAKDERDMLIESKAFRNAYYFLIFAIISVVMNVFISDYLSTASGEVLMLSMPFMTLHVLVLVLFAALLIKAATQIFYYQRGV